MLYVKIIEVCHTKQISVQQLFEFARRTDIFAHEDFVFDYMCFLCILFGCKNLVIISKIGSENNRIKEESYCLHKEHCMSFVKGVLLSEYARERHRNFIVLSNHLFFQRKLLFFQYRYLRMCVCVYICSGSLCLAYYQFLFSSQYLYSVRLKWPNLLENFPSVYHTHFCVYFLIVTIFISYLKLMDMCLLMLLTASCYR